MIIRNLLVCAIYLASARGLSAQSTADEQALRDRIASHERASATGDLRGLVDVYSIDAEMISSSGTVMRGREAIEAYYSRSLSTDAAKSGRHHTHPTDRIAIRFITADVALVDLPSRSTGGRAANGEPLADSEVMLITIWRKGSNGWLVVSQRALPVTAK